MKENSIRNWVEPKWIPNISSKVYTKGTLEAFFPPNPQASQKERNHDRLEKCKKKAESREPITIRHENEEVYTSDSETA